MNNSQAIITLSEILQLEITTHPKYLPKTDKIQRLGIICTGPSRKYYTYLKFFQILFQYLRVLVYLNKNKYTTEGIYAVYPTLENPTVTYQLNSKAQNYVEDNIITRRNSVLKRLLTRLFIMLIGFDPSISTFVIIVKK